MTKICENLPSQWKDYLKKELKDDRESFIARMTFLEEDALESHTHALKQLDRNNYELFLRFEKYAEDEEEEAAYMRELLNEEGING